MTTGTRTTRYAPRPGAALAAALLLATLACARGDDRAPAADSTHPDSARAAAAPATAPLTEDDV